MKLLALVGGAVCCLLFVTAAVTALVALARLRWRTRRAPDRDDSAGER